MGCPHLRNARTGWSGPHFLPLTTGSLHGPVTCLTEGAHPCPDDPLARPLWLRHQGVLVSSHKSPVHTAALTHVAMEALTHMHGRVCTHSHTHTLHPVT